MGVFMEMVLFVALMFIQGGMDSQDILFGKGVLATIGILIVMIVIALLLARRGWQNEHGEKR